MNKGEIKRREEEASEVVNIIESLLELCYKDFYATYPGKHYECNDYGKVGLRIFYGLSHGEGSAISMTVSVPNTGEVILREDGNLVSAYREGEWSKSLLADGEKIASELKERYEEEARLVEKKCEERVELAFSPIDY